MILTRVANYYSSIILFMKFFWLGKGKTFPKSAVFLCSMLEGFGSYLLFLIWIVEKLISSYYQLSEQTKEMKIYMYIYYTKKIFEIYLCNCMYKLWMQKQLILLLNTKTKLVFTNHDLVFFQFQVRSFWKWNSAEYHWDKMALLMTCFIYILDSSFSSSSKFCSKIRIRGKGFFLV